MEKQKEIKISADLDYIYLRVDGALSSRWPITKLAFSKLEIKAGITIPQKTLSKAKVAAFDLLWHYDSVHPNSAKIVPYLN